MLAFKVSYTSKRKQSKPQIMNKDFAIVTKSETMENDSDDMSKKPANMMNNRLILKEDSKGQVRHFWLRQEISKTHDITCGYLANKTLGWYDLANDRKAQTSALRDLAVQGIAAKDFALGSRGEKKNGGSSSA